MNFHVYKVQLEHLLVYIHNLFFFVDSDKKVFKTNNQFLKFGLSEIYTDQPHVQYLNNK